MSKTARCASPSELERGLDLIRRGEFFAAHEELEDAWRAAPAEERDFFQGLVHVAVAWYQAGRGRRIGTERQLAKAAGVFSVAVPGAYPNRDALVTAGADVLVDSLRDLAVILSRADGEGPVA